ncbi:hypothetical protein CBS14141_001368 [Malassezia furfur]|nr:hypothetical protein CBS14141_001368 [Malassezia furfur]
MASAVGLFAAGAVAGYFAHYARRAWWPQGEVVLSDSEEELEDDDGREGEDDAAAPASEECKMVLGVRTDLKMDKGKIAAQCGHATLAAYRLAKRITPRYVQTWQRLGQTKIAIKVPNEEGLQSLAEAAKSLGVAARIIQDAYVTHTHPGAARRWSRAVAP